MSLQSSISIPPVVSPSFIPFASLLFIGAILFITIATATTEQTTSLPDNDNASAEQDNHDATIASITEYASVYITQLNHVVSAIKLIDIRRRNDTRNVLQTVVKQLRAIDPKTGKLRTYMIPREEERAVPVMTDVSVQFDVSVALGGDASDIVNVVMAVSRDHDKFMAVTMLRSANQTERSLTADINVRRLLTRGRTASTEFAASEAKRRAEAVNTPASPFVDLTAEEIALMNAKERERHERLRHRRAQHYASTQPRTAEEISILSANLWNYNHWEKRLPNVVQELKRINADIICFQEVRARKISKSNTNNNHFMIQDLTEYKNNENNNNNILLDDYEFIYEPIMGFQDGDDFVHEGLAIFSKFPIISTYLLLLNRDKNDENDFHQRAVLCARILTPHGYIQVMTTHMSLSERARTRTVHEIGQYINKINNKAEPIILLGDMNAEANDSSILTLTNQYNLIDIWPYIHGIDNSRSSSAYTFNTWSPKSRIDYIFVKGMKPTRAFIEANIGIHTTGLQPVGGVIDMKDSLFPSDHMFLLGFLERKQDETIATVDFLPSKRC